MSAEKVVAVLKEPSGLGLTEQDGAVDAVFTGDNALLQAIESNSEWLWLLAPGVHPETGALEHLLRATTPTADPVAAVVAGAVLDGSGRPVKNWLPAPQYADSAAILRLVPQRLLPIRHAPFANCLVRRSAFALFGVPDTARFGPYAARAWTAAVMRREPGYFAPLSVARLTDRASSTSRRDTLAGTYYALRVAGTGIWTKGESLRELKRIVEDMFDSDAR
jgi:hypothetical protein